jgi:uncharacterized membrane protein
MSEKNTARVEAFSDGVFAIALTLLILEIRVPHLADGASNRELGSALLALWPSFLAFLLSFGVVLTMWINHHEFMRVVERADARFLFANGFLLLMVTFVPFPTALLAQYLGTRAANAAVAFYCGTFVMVNIAFNVLLYSVVKNRRLLFRDKSDTSLTKVRKAYQWALLGVCAFVRSCAVQCRRRTRHLLHALDRMGRPRIHFKGKLIRGRPCCS